jgi:hypothetical protein
MIARSRAANKLFHARFPLLVTSIEDSSSLRLSCGGRGKTRGTGHAGISLYRHPPRAAMTAGMAAARKLQKVILVLGIVAVAIAVWDVATGGFYFTVAGVRLSSREAGKPLRLGMLAIVAAIWLNERMAAAQSRDTIWERLPAWSPRIAAGAALASLLAAIHFGVFAAGGADAYGYVTQASLWARGNLVVPDPLAALEPALGAAVAPMGYRLAPTPGAIVPVYPPGYPMTMAIALTLGGATAVYYVVPLLGGLTVWLTYLLGARVDRPVTGMMAAILVAFSPIVMFHTFEPMSDVPATAWWLLAWVLALPPTRLAAFGSGLAVSAAVVTRPNLVPLALVLAAVVASHAPRTRRAALFAAGSIPGCLIVAAVNAWLYGSPLAAGFGSFEMLYGWRHWKANLQTYGGWLTELHSPFIFVAVLAPLVARVRHVAAMLAFFLVLCLCYLWYTPFSTWPFLRFLLPAIPLLFILSSAVAVRAVNRVPLSLRAAAVFVVCTMLPLWYVITLHGLTQFATQRADHRYVAIGKYLGQALPPNVVVLSMIQSGSIRLYGDRLTVRWDMLAPDKLDAAVATLEASGYRPYLLLEDWEVPIFRDLFGAANQFGRLDWPPAFEYRDLGKVSIYQFADRGRYLSGVAVAPRPVPLDR